MFDIQIEVKNPTEMWHIPPDANLHMLKLCSVFSGVISDLLMKSAKPFGYEHMLLIRSPMKHLMKEFHRNSGKKAYHSGVLVFPLATWERFLPMWDFLLQGDEVTLDHPMWTDHECDVAQVVWRNRVRVHNYMVQLHSEDGNVFSMKETESALKHLDFGVQDISIEQELHGEVLMNLTTFNAQIETQEFKKTYEQKFMFGDKECSVRLIWKPLKRVSPKVRAEQARLSYAEAVYQKASAKPHLFKDVQSTYALPTSQDTPQLGTWTNLAPVETEWKHVTHKKAKRMGQPLGPGDVPTDIGPSSPSPRNGTKRMELDALSPVVGLDTPKSTSHILGQ
jgi:hypothetical protein